MTERLEMVERVGAALLSCDPGASWTAIGEPERRIWRRQACRVLAAMREPTDAMVEAAAMFFSGRMGWPWRSAPNWAKEECRRDARAALVAAIDAALEEKQ